MGVRTKTGAQRGETPVTQDVEYARDKRVYATQLCRTKPSGRRGTFKYQESSGEPTRWGNICRGAPWASRNIRRKAPKHLTSRGQGEKEAKTYRYDVLAGQATQQAKSTPCQRVLSVRRAVGASVASPISIPLPITVHPSDPVSTSFTVRTSPFVLVVQLHEALPIDTKQRTRAFRLNVSLSDATGLISFITCANPPARLPRNNARAH